MTAAIIDLHTRTTRPAGATLTDPATPWWTAQTWCDGTCHGGDTVRFDSGGPEIVTSRAHFGTTLDTTMVNIDGAVEFRATVGVHAVEYDTEGFTEPAVVTFEVAGAEVWISADDADRLADALTTASAAARSTKTPRSPSFAGGDRASTTAVTA